MASPSVFRLFVYRCPKCGGDGLAESSWWATFWSLGYSRRCEPCVGRGWIQTHGWTPVPREELEAEGIYL